MTVDVAAPPRISPQGRDLLRHAHLRHRARRLEQTVRALREPADRPPAPTLRGFEQELSATRRELRALAAQGRPTTGVPADVGSATSPDDGGVRPS